MANILSQLFGQQNLGGLGAIMGLLNGMNDPNAMVNMLMGTLKSQNPQGYEEVQKLMQSGRNPQEIMQSYLKDVTPQQKQQMRQMASQFGIPQDVINSIK